MRLRALALGLILILGLAGCTGNSPSVPAQDASPTVASVPTRPQVTGPTITFVPRNGGPGTKISIKGANFKPGGKVTIRLGTPKPVGEALAAADVGKDGRWSTTATIPGTLPSGEPIKSKAPGDVQIVAMDESNNTVASEPFDFGGGGQSSATAQP